MLSNSRNNIIKTIAIVIVVVIIIPALNGGVSCM
ncbi:MAG: hypothetical protein RLZZ316_2042 [Bacteroidota bacterium]|jgi:hypothetical protein